MSVLQGLVKGQRVTPPPPAYVYDCIQYETIMGSEAYGCADTAKSDKDMYGFCIPPKTMVFPHLDGHIAGFGRQGPAAFNNWQRHHLIGANGTSYDFDVYGIVRYFQLIMECNPNMIDSLFTPERCVTHKTPVAQIVRENRKLFLSKKAFHTFKGYAYSQVHKMKTKNPEVGSTRLAGIQKYGYDVKFAYHVVRLVEECHQILAEYDLDITRNREQLKSIRAGEWKEDDVYKFFDERQHALHTAYEQSVIPHSPDEKAIRTLLMSCLEQHFGSLSGVISAPGRAEEILAKVRQIVGEQ